MKIILLTQTTVKHLFKCARSCSRFSNIDQGLNNRSCSINPLSLYGYLLRLSYIWIMESQVLQSHLIAVNRKCLYGLLLKQNEKNCVLLVYFLLKKIYQSKGFLTSLLSKLIGQSKGFLVSLLFKQNNQSQGFLVNLILSKQNNQLHQKRYMQSSKFLCMKANLPCILYNTSFLKRLQLVISGDVEKNPGPSSDESLSARETIESSCRKYFENCSNYKNNITDKIHIVQQDITSVLCDAIVNAANETLLGGGGIDGVIHAKAGPELLKKCLKFIEHENNVRCYPGEVKITDTYGTNLTNCKYVFHTVGPDLRKDFNMDYNKKVLRSCYEKCLESLLVLKIRSVSFCCISTGIYKYPNEDAASVAVDVVKSWLEKNYSYVDKVIFCTYLSTDYDIYTRLLTNNNTNDIKSFDETVSIPYEDDIFMNECFPSDMPSPNCINDIDMSECFFSDVPSILDANIDIWRSEKCSNLKDHDEKPLTTECFPINDPDLDMDSPITEACSDDNHLIDFSISDVVNKNIPVKLYNASNVCFFNSSVQILYFLESFNEHICNTLLNTLVISNIRVIFRKIYFEQLNNSMLPIYTHQIVESLNIPRYRVNEQHDVCDFLEYILDNCFPRDTIKKDVTIHSLFKITINKSLLCNNCNKESFSQDVTPIFQLDIEKTQELQSISELFERTFDSRGRFNLEYRCEQQLDQSNNVIEGCNEVGTCTESLQLTDIGDFLIICLRIYTEDDEGNKSKFIPNLIIDQELVKYDYFDLNGIIWHHGKSLEFGHYTSNVKVNGVWYNTNDSVISIGSRFECSSSEPVAPYVLVYKKRLGTVIASSNIDDLVPYSTSDEIVENPFSEEVLASKVILSNGIERNSNNSLNTEDVMEQTKSRLFNFGKRKSKFSNAHNQSSKVYMRKILATDEGRAKHREQSNKYMNKILATEEGRAKHRKQLNEYMNKILATEEGKKKHRERARESMNKILATADGKMKHQISSSNSRRIVQKKRDGKDNETKIQGINQLNQTRVKKDLKSRKKAFDEVKDMSMVQPSIIDTTAYKIVENEFLKLISVGPEFKCEICLTWNYRTSVMKFKTNIYDQTVLNKCYVNCNMCSLGLWICNTCDRHLKKDKVPPKANANNLQVNPKYDEFEILNTMELMLCSQVIPFMFIVGKQRGSQHGLKGQCVLVPADIKKIQTVLPRQCDDNHIISLTLKRRLSDKSFFTKQNIRPALVNRALAKFVEINPHYKNICWNETWENESEQTDPELWNLLTNKNAETNDSDIETDSDDEIEDNKLNETEKQSPSVSFPTALHNINGPNITPEQVINIAPGEGQTPISHYNEENWEALAFPKHYAHGINHFGSFRDIPLTPSKYAHVRLKSIDDRFSKDTQYIFHLLDWVEKACVASSISIAERKHFQGDLKAGQVNSQNVLRHMSDNQLFASFKDIRGTPQYWNRMLLDVLAKVRAKNVHTFFLTFSWAEAHRTEIIKIVARQYGTNLTDEDVNQMSWQEKSTWLKRNPVTVARHINYILQQLIGPKVIFSGMHPIGQILNIDSKIEFQHRGNEHLHCAIHIVDAPKIDIDPDSVVTEFIDKYITCSLPDSNLYPELHQVVKTVQTHHHTTTCSKKQGTRCRFNAPWPPSDRTMIVRGSDFSKEKQEKSRLILDEVLCGLNRPDLSDLTVEDLLHECNLSLVEYENALEVMKSKISIIYKRKPSEVYISPYNTVLLNLTKSNMNLQFVTGVYGMLGYLTKYLCKAEHGMSELMKKASKEGNSHSVREKLRKIGNVFLTKREISTHEAIVRLLSLPMRSSNIGVIFIPTGFKNQRTRILKPQKVLDTMDPDDSNIFCTNFLERYANRPDDLEDMSYADFATNYKPVKDDKKIDDDDVENYTAAITELETEASPKNLKRGRNIVLKNNVGKMKKRDFPCIMRYYKGSEQEDPEHYYMTLLQLYLPWRNENDLKNGYFSYKEKFKDIESLLKNNIERHDCFYGIYDDEDMIGNVYESSDDEEIETGADEFVMLNPELIDMATEQNSEASVLPVPSAIVDNISMSRDEFFESCCQLNKGQQFFFPL